MNKIKILIILFLLLGVSQTNAIKYGTYIIPDSDYEIIYSAGFLQLKENGIIKITGNHAQFSEGKDISEIAFADQYSSFLPPSVGFGTGSALIWNTQSAGGVYNLLGGTREKVIYNEIGTTKFSLNLPISNWGPGYERLYIYHGLGSLIEFRGPNEKPPGNRIITNDGETSVIIGSNFYTISSEVDLSTDPSYTCNIKNIPIYEYVKVDFNENALEKTESEKILVSDGVSNISIRNGKSFSGSLKGLVNGDNSFTFDSLLISNQTPVIKFSTGSGGVNYFEINGTGNFYPLVYLPFEKHYKTKVCGGGNLLNPEQSNNNNVIGNEGQIYFEIGKRYTMPVAYDCLEFEFYMEFIGDINLSKFNIGRNKITEWKDKQVCKKNDSGEVFIDGNSFSGSLDEVGSDGSVKVKKISIYNKIGIDQTLEYQESLDKNGDGVISYSEATGGIMGWIYGFIEGIQKSASSVMDFLSSFTDFGNVESKSLLGWLIPSASADNSILNEFKAKADNYAENDSKSKDVLRLVYWLIITLIFILVLFIMGKK